MTKSFKKVNPTFPFLSAKKSRSMANIYLLLGSSLLLGYVSHKLLSFWNAVRLVGLVCLHHVQKTAMLKGYVFALLLYRNHPGKRLLFSPFMGMFLPKIRYLTTGSNFDMDEKYERAPFELNNVCILTADLYISNTPAFVNAGWDICTIVIYTNHNLSGIIHSCLNLFRSLLHRAQRRLFLWLMLKQ